METPASDPSSAPASPTSRRPFRPLQTLVLGLVLVGASGLILWPARLIYLGWKQQQLVKAEYAPAPEGMVFVPAGGFIMGSDHPDADPDETPARKVFLPAFYIDKYEVTNREYREFDPEHTYPEGRDDFPVTAVLKADAQAYASWKGKRLPTSAEWEKAARGTDGRKYPWGNEFNPAMANLRPYWTNAFGELEWDDRNLRDALDKVAVGSFPQGVSPYGCEDMTGNVWEWVSDNYEVKSWLLDEDEERVTGIIRGGAYGYNIRHGRTTHQGFEPLNTTCNDVGFRCAMDAIPKR